MAELLAFLEQNGFRGLTVTSPSGRKKLCTLASDRHKTLELLSTFGQLRGVDVRYSAESKGRLGRLIPRARLKYFGLSRAKVEIVGREQESIECQLEFWKEHDDYFEAASPNHISRRLWKTTAEAHGLFSPGSVRNYADILAHRHASQPSFPIDLVFTWVNASDPDWQQLFSRYAPERATDATGSSRFHNRDELMYALRSWAKYGTFIRKIFIVSNCRPPAWLNTEHEQIVWVPHETILPQDALPTFNSHAIEACLHKIPGLADHFIYSNDDFFLTRNASPSNFFYPNGIVKVRLEGYGQVNGVPHLDHPAYLNGARNANALLEREFSKSTTELVTHSPYSLRRDILEAMEEKFSDQFRKTVHNRFRAPEDIAVTSYLHAHYSILDGKGVPDKAGVWLIQPNHKFEKRMARLLRRQKRGSGLPLSVCLNDGGDSDQNARWNAAVDRFLPAFFPEKSPFER